jgi:hypothetical protein
MRINGVGLFVFAKKEIDYGEVIMNTMNELTAAENCQVSAATGNNALEFSFDDTTGLMANASHGATINAIAQMDNDEDDGISGLPVLRQEQMDTMLYGLIGKIAKVGAHGKGLHPAPIALAVMTWLSAAVSPRIKIPVGDSIHPARLFSVHVGRSATGGKGDSIALLKKIIAYLDAKYPQLTPMFHSGGLSTREGLALKLHDGFEEKGKEIPAVLDKRLMIVESEFVKLLKLGKNDTNSILAVIRELWDFGGSIKPLTKTAPICSTNPHISIYGNVTPEELKANININEIYGGTVNRFLFLFAERLEMVAFPQETQENLVNAIAEDVAEVILWAKATYGTGRDDDCPVVNLAEDAKQLWEKEFSRLMQRFGTSVVAEATNRRAPYALRIAPLFAITDKSLVITANHLKAAIAWVDASAQTAEYLFGTPTSKSKVNPLHKEKLIKFLQAQPKREATRTEISKHGFSGKLKKHELDHLLNGLVGSLIDKHDVILANRSKKSTYKLV